jgi:hypothetical protein
MIFISFLFHSCAKTFDTGYNNVTLKIDSIVPANGTVGTPVRIYGTGFALNVIYNKIYFNGTPATIDNSNANTIGVLLAYAPANGKTGNVSVANGTDSATGPLFTYSILAPHILTISPTTGYPFATVTITGNNFSATVANDIVLFNNVKATILSADTNRLQVQVPLPASYPQASIPVTVTVNGMTSNGAQFQYINYVPTITSINPTSGIAGTQVTITGTNFLTDTSKMTVLFNGVKAAFVSASTTKLTVTAPKATTGNVSVTIIPYNATAAGSVFTYFLAPVITSINPTSGQAGTTVTITGSNFVADTSKNAVYFNGVKAAVISATTTQIVVYAPNSTTGNVSVTSNGLTGTGPVFTYVVVPAITNISFAQNTNYNFIISGNNFDPVNSVVKFDGQVINGFTYTAGSPQKLSLPLNLLPSNLGNPIQVTVTVNNNASNAYPFLFTPQINSVSPDTVSYQETVSLQGKFFGNTQGTSTIKAFYYDQGQNKTYMTPNPTVVSWNTNNIQITMPDYGGYPIGSGSQPFYLEVNVGSNIGIAVVYFHIE